jgi:hypothetical protein
VRIREISCGWSHRIIHNDEFAFETECYTYYHAQMNTSVSIECPACGTANQAFPILYRNSPASSFHCMLCGWIVAHPILITEEDVGQPSRSSSD